MKRELPIGIDNYRELKEKNYYVVDKSNLIKDFLSNGIKVTLITRPRRFGKTINLSMLAEFLDMRKESKKLFEDTDIMKTTYMTELNQHPVIFLSFADVKQNNYQDAVQKIKNIIVDAYRQHRYLEQEECFTQNEKQQMLEITEKMSDVTAQDALKNLSSYLNLLYGKKVLIFLDEYDTPMQEA